MMSFLKKLYKTFVQFFWLLLYTPTFPDFFRIGTFIDSK